MKRGLLNFTWPSILLIITGLIGLIRYFLVPLLSTIEDILIAIFNVCFFAGLGLLINKNYNWTKYIVLVLAVFGLINFPALRLHESTPIAIISITYLAQRLLLAAAAILLFKQYITGKSVEG